MQNIALPYNTRAPQQWEIISSRIDFEGKAVLDLGCGYADILLRCWRAGANYCLGIEGDGEVWEFATNRALATPITILKEGIFEFMKSCEGSFRWNVVVCFSVLPYLSKPFEALQWIKDYSQVALIECQYYGDGPGSKPWLVKTATECENTYQAPPKTDDNMQQILEGIGWRSVEPIGKTFVEGRDKWRTIWRCSSYD